MKHTKKLIIGILASCAVGVTIVYAGGLNPRHPVEFYKGHTHIHDTEGAPSHSGGTDKFGCHNGSVPYHCH